MQAELQKERQAKENVLAQLQLAAERELENTDLLQQLNTLQVCSHRQMQNSCFFFFCFLLFIYIYIYGICDTPLSRVSYISALSLY